MTSPIFNVQARMSEIQSRFDAIQTQTTVPGGRLGATDDGSSFDSVYQNYLSLQGKAGTTTTGAPSGSDIINKAMGYLGIPYVWGGDEPETGLDCSGFVQDVYDQFGIHLPRVSRDQAKAGEKIDSLSEAKPGDLVAFGSPVDHIGIYMGDNKMVVAPHTGDVVKVQSLGNRKPTAIRRILPDSHSINFAKTASAQASASNYSIPNVPLTGGVVQYDGPNGSRVTTTASDTRNRLVSSSIETPDEYANLFTSIGQQYGIDPALLASLSRTESNFRNEAVSSTGALGMMQFMPATAQGMDVDPTDPASAIAGTARLLGGHKDKFGSWELALAAYQAGAGTVSRQGGMPKSSVTQNYVNKIMNLWSDARS